MEGVCLVFVCRGDVLCVWTGCVWRCVVYVWRLGVGVERDVCVEGGVYVDGRGVFEYVEGVCV